MPSLGAASAFLGFFPCLPPFSPLVLVLHTERSYEKDVTAAARKYDQIAEIWMHPLGGADVDRMHRLEIFFPFNCEGNLRGSARRAGKAGKE